MRAFLVATFVIIFFLPQVSASATQPLSLSCNEKPTIPGSCQPNTSLVGATVHRAVLFFVHFQYNFTFHDFRINASGVLAGQTASVLLTPHRRTLSLNFTSTVGYYQETWSTTDFCPATPDDITGCDIVPVSVDLQSGPTAPAAKLRVCLTDLTSGASSCLDLQFPAANFGTTTGTGYNYYLIFAIVAIGIVAEAVWFFYARRPRLPSSSMLTFLRSVKSLRPSRP